MSRFPHSIIDRILFRLGWWRQCEAGRDSYGDTYYCLHHRWHFGNHRDTTGREF